MFYICVEGWLDFYCARNLVSGICFVYRGFKEKCVEKRL